MKGAMVKQTLILWTMGLAWAGVLGVSVPVRAESPSDRLARLTAKFDEMQKQPDKRVPADVLHRAQGIILLDRTKAGFIFAYQGGGGVAMVRDGRESWSPVAFLTASEASLGLQIGGEQNFFVILLMTTNATHELTDSTIDFGGEARGTAGDQSSGVEGQAAPKDSVLVYCERSGLYGGAAIKGGAISPDGAANQTYYSQNVTMDDILFGKKVKPTDAATNLAKKISEYSKK